MSRADRAVATRFRTVTVRLAEDERYMMRTETGRIMAEHFTFTDASFVEGGRVDIRGWAALKDGTQGLIERRTSRPVTSIPREVAVFAHGVLNVPIPFEI